MLQRLIRFLVAIILSTTLVKTAHADYAESMCSAFMPAIEQSISMREQGAPQSIAMNLADSAFNLDRELFQFVSAAIRVAYINPQGLRRMLQTGELMRECIKSVNGY